MFGSTCEVAMHDVIRSSAKWKQNNASEVMPHVFRVPARFMIGSTSVQILNLNMFMNPRKNL